MLKRKFIQAASVGITSLISLPVLGIGNNTCTVSGAMSGNMSNARQDNDPCSTYSGKSAGERKIDLNNNFTYNGLGKDSTTFDIFATNFPHGSDITLIDALEYAVSSNIAIQQLLGEAVAAYFNALDSFQNYPYTGMDIINMYNLVYSGTNTMADEQILYTSLNTLNNMR